MMSICMARHQVNIFTVLLILIGISSAQARTVYFGSEPEVISINYGSAKIFRFPSDVRTVSQATRFIIGPADPNQPNYSVLSVKARFPSGIGNVVFILNDGSLVKTRLQISGAEASAKDDPVYDFKSKDSLATDGTDKSLSSDLPAMELMKALVRGDNVTSYDVHNVSREITSGIKNVSAKLVRVYSSDKFKGYIFELSKNSGPKKVSLNIQGLTLGEPNQAVLSNVDSPVLGGDGENKTYLHIVAKPTSTYSDLILPTELEVRN